MNSKHVRPATDEEVAEVMARGRRIGEALTTLELPDDDLTATALVTVIARALHHAGVTGEAAHAALDSAMADIEPDPEPEPEALS